MAKTTRTKKSTNVLKPPIRPSLKLAPRGRLRDIVDEYARPRGMTRERLAYYAVDILENRAAILEEYPLAGRNLREADAALSVRYFNLDGTPSDHRQARALYRAEVDVKTRWLGKLDQSPDIYIPPPHVFNFAELLSGKLKPGQARTKVVITEGAINVLTLCAAGFPAVGVEGVANFIRFKGSRQLHPKLVALADSPNIQLVMGFDSDCLTNGNITAQLNKGTAMLTNIGHPPLLLFVPDADDGSKVSVGDYLHAHGVDAFDTLLNTARMSEYGATLLDMAARYVYLTEQGCFIDLQVNRLRGVEHLRLNTANQQLEQVEVAPVKNNKSKRETPIKVGRPIDSALNEYLASDVRNEAFNVGFEPAEDTFYEEYEVMHGVAVRNRMVNLYTGYACGEPTHDTQISADLQELTMLLCSGREEVQLALRRILSQPYLWPGEKLPKYIIMTGSQGVGKSTLALIFLSVAGRYGTSGSIDRVLNQNNRSIYCKQFVVIEEVASAEKNLKVGVVVKDLTARTTFEYNEKYRREIELNDYVTYLILSNNKYLDVKLDHDDRRALVIDADERVPVDLIARLKRACIYVPLRGRSSAANLAERERVQRGQQAVLHWMMDTTTEGYNPRNYNLETEERADLIVGLGSPVETAVKRLLLSGDVVLDGEYTGAQILTTKEFARALGVEVPHSPENPYPSINAQRALATNLGNARLPHLNSPIRPYRHPSEVPKGSSDKYDNKVVFWGTSQKHAKLFKAANSSDHTIKLDAHRQLRDLWAEHKVPAPTPSKLTGNSQPTTTKKGSKPK